MWENDWDIDSIILSGGGSVELSEYLSPNIDGNVVSIGKNIDARFNNVQGYCKFGRYKWGYSRYLSESKEKQKSKEPSADEKNEKTNAPDDDDIKNEKSSKGLSWLRRQS